jgi:hypothetical protein
MPHQHSEQRHRLRHDPFVALVRISERQARRQLAQRLLLLVEAESPIGFVACAGGKRQTGHDAVHGGQRCQAFGALGGQEEDLDHRDIVAGDRSREPLPFTASSRELPSQLTPAEAGRVIRDELDHVGQHPTQVPAAVTGELPLSIAEGWVAHRRKADVQRLKSLHS